jgi:glycosyltransferase involved in cell wall biosynthesis
MNQENGPLISIIIAVYNGKNTLQQCIDSVSQQTYLNRELIIIDGGSNDGSVELLGENDDKISYWLSEADNGVYSAWNKGLLIAQGDWICFLGSDDYFWDNSVLERMVLKLQAIPADISVAYGQIMLVNDDGQSQRTIGESWSLLRESFKQNMCIPHVGTMHRRSLFQQHGNFDESFQIAGDYEFLLRELKTADAIFIPDIVSVGQRLGGISTVAENRFHTLREVWRAQRLNGQLLPKAYLRHELLREFFRLSLRMIFGKQLGEKILDLLFHTIYGVRRFFRKPTTVLKLLWTLKDACNRKRMISLIREYVEDIENFKSVATQLKSPYNVEAFNSGSDLNILLVLHEFSRTGAPYAALYLAMALFSINGIRPVIFSPMDGPLRDEFEREGFNTVVDPLLFGRYRDLSSEACDFVANFQKVIVVSLASFGFIDYFRGIGKNISWWLHETEMDFEVVSRKTDLPLLFASCNSIWLGSPLCIPLALQYAPKDKLHLLIYGCPDTALPHRVHSSEKIVFSIFGSIDERKGQDIFISSIERLPQELRTNAIFRVIGSPLSHGPSYNYYKKLKAKANKIPEIEFFDNMPFDRLQEFYAGTDVFVSTSRDDPMPIVITHGLMFSKTCLCSSVIGHAQLLKDGVNGLVFESESVDALVDKITWILQNHDQLAVLGKAGRAKYDEHFNMSSFIHNVTSLMQNVH